MEYSEALAGVVKVRPSKSSDTIQAVVQLATSLSVAAAYAVCEWLGLSKECVVESLLLVYVSALSASVVFFAAYIFRDKTPRQRLRSGFQVLKLGLIHLPIVDPLIFWAGFIVTFFVHDLSLGTGIFCGYCVTMLLRAIWLRMTSEEFTRLVVADLLIQKKWYDMLGRAGDAFLMSMVETVPEKLPKADSDFYSDFDRRASVCSFVRMVNAQAAMTLGSDMHKRTTILAQDKGTELTFIGTTEDGAVVCTALTPEQVATLTEPELVDMVMDRRDGSDIEEEIAE